MPRLCYVCREKKPSFKFPENEDILEQWVKILNIEFPRKLGPSGERICINHFKESDILIGKSRTNLKSTALPLHFKINILDCNNNSSEISKLNAMKAASILANMC